MHHLFLSMSLKLVCIFERKIGRTLRSRLTCRRQVTSWALLLPSRGSHDRRKRKRHPPLPSWKKVCESPAVASWVNIYTEMALMMREVNSPECLRQGRQVFFVLPHLACVYLSSGVKCFFVVQFLFKLELDVFVCERSSGCRIQFLTLLHLPGSPSQEGP